MMYSSDLLSAMNIQKSYTESPKNGSGGNQVYSTFNNFSVLPHTHCMAKQPAIPLPKTGILPLTYRNGP